MNSKTDQCVRSASSLAMKDKSQIDEGPMRVIRDNSLIRPLIRDQCDQSSTKTDHAFATCKAAFASSESVFGVAGLSADIPEFVPPERSLCGDGHSVGCILDGGASHRMSSCLEHFEHVSDNEVTLVVADRELSVPARIGAFRSNSLGIRTGLCHPGLVAVLPSVSRMKSQGFEVHFGKNSWVQFENKAPVSASWRKGAPILRTMFSTEGQSAFRAVGKDPREKVPRHARSAHFHLDEVGGISCTSCNLVKDYGAKGRKGGASITCPISAL